MTGPVIPMVVFCMTCGLTVFYLLKSRHLERMAKIENGMEDHSVSNGRLLFNMGLFLGFLGLGLMSAFGCAYWFGTKNYIFVPGFLMIFGGIALLVAFYLQQKQVK